MVLNLRRRSCRGVLLGSSKGVKEGDTVKRTQRIASINVGEGVVGRVVRYFRNPIDGKGPLKVNFSKCHWSVKLQVLFFVSQ